MKVHVVKEGGEVIKGFKPILIKNGVINFSDVSDNECTFILANDILDEFPVENVQDCIFTLLKKLRIGGSIVIGGTDLRLFCKNVTNGLLEGNEASRIVQNSRSMSDYETVCNIIRSTNLKIETTQISGVHYEIKSARR